MGHGRDGIAAVRGWRDWVLKVAANVASYKIWILAAATWLLASDALSEYFWVILAALVISERFAEKLLGLGGFAGRRAARPPVRVGGGDENTDPAQGVGERCDQNGA